MIKGHCRTNLDDYRRSDWPEVFAAVPHVGDRVWSIGHAAALKVCAIAHTANWNKEANQYEPFIIVELNK